MTLTQKNFWYYLYYTTVTQCHAIPSRVNACGRLVNLKRLRMLLVSLQNVICFSRTIHFEITGKPPALSSRAFCQVLTKGLFTCNWREEDLSTRKILAPCKLPSLRRSQHWGQTWRQPGVQLLLADSFSSFPSLFYHFGLRPKFQHFKANEKLFLLLGSQLGSSSLHVNSP